MANIVTQLQNKDGDNLYPLAGGMAADSITTAMIQDGAVTDSKINWTALDSGWTNISSNGDLKYRKLGHTVTIAYISSAERTLTGYAAYILANTLDESLRPGTNLRFAVYSKGNSAIYGQIYAVNGQVLLFNWDSSATFESGQLAFTVTYTV